MLPGKRLRDAGWEVGTPMSRLAGRVANEVADRPPVPIGGGYYFLPDTAAAAGAADAADAVNAPNAVGAANAANAVNAVGMPNAVNAPNAVGMPNAANAVGAPNTVGMPNAANAVGMPNTANAVGAPNTVGMPNTANTVGMPNTVGAANTVSDISAARADFPVLQRRVNGKPLVWLDNAATTQKPRSVIQALSSFYENSNSNIHRSAHTLAAEATQAYENARAAVARLLGAASSQEIVFVRGTTEAMNLAANVIGRQLSPGDEIVVSRLEHHANIVPWQMIAKQRGLVLRAAPIDDTGQLDMAGFERLLGPRTRVVSIAHVSNALGTVLPVREVVERAHAHNAIVVVDGAQAVPHLPVDVQALGADVYAFSGHKLYAPTGIGALYARRELLDSWAPWQGGGGMIEHVTFEHTRYTTPPVRFEAGTPNIADAIGLGAAIEYVLKLGMDRIAAHGAALMAHADRVLDSIPGLRRFSTAAHRVGPLAFNMPPLRCDNLAAFLDRQGIALRAGHHCAQPTMARFGVDCMVRPSFALYNTTAEIDTLAEALEQARHTL